MTIAHMRELKRLRAQHSADKCELSHLAELANKWMKAYAEIEDLLFSIHAFVNTHPRKFSFAKGSGIARRIRK